MSDGITVLPARFTRVAPAGTRTSLARPTAVKRLPVTTKVAFSIGARPSPTMTRAPSKTVTLFCASVVSGSAAIAARTRSFARCMAPSSGGTLSPITKGEGGRTWVQGVQGVQKVPFRVFTRFHRVHHGVPDGGEPSEQG